MFTPPPSPRPSRLKKTNDFEKQPVQTEEILPAIEDHKRAIGRRMRWAVLLVPLVLILVTLSTRYLTHDTADLLSKPPPSLRWPKIIYKWTLHRRNPQPQTPSPTTASIVFPTSPLSTTSAISAQPTATAAPQNVPTIPSSPPPLPIPFPQPFDTALGSNFSTVGCLNFFINMTNTAPFRDCRPFSVLLSSSSAFINAQLNITALNDIVWGTCNANPGKGQCTSNMGWFASALQSACQKDLKDANANAVNTLQSLRAYSLMFDAGCLSDPTTNSYCYVSAVANSNPSDVYFYNLPLGFNLPNSTASTCSACTKSLLGLYAAGLGSSTGSTLTGLRKTYQNAVGVAQSQCGQAYAHMADTAGAAGLRAGMGSVWGVVVVLLAGWSILP